MDIKSLYTVIPNNGGLEALTYYLDQRTIKEPPAHTLTRLAELVLTLNAFSFNDQHYRQIGGVAMGTKMGPNYACMIVGCIEERIRAQYTGFVPQLHKRYIDDVVGAAQCTRPELEQFIDYVCNFQPALQFTFTISELELPFLDIKLAITNNRIQTSIYYKETDTHNYLHFTLFHPRHCKQAIPYSQFLRLPRICSNDVDFSEKAEEMLTFFKRRGYPEPQLHSDLQMVATISRDEALSPTHVNRVLLVLTYHPFNTVTRKILLDNFNILSTDPETRGIFPESPLVSYRRDKNLRDFLVHSSSGSQRPLDTLFPAIAPAVRHASTLRFRLFYMGPRAHIPSKIASPVSLRMWCTASLAAVAPACTSVRPEGAYRNASVSICIASATGLLGFL